MVALGDGAFNCKDIIEICNKKGAYFIFSAKINNYFAYQMMKQKFVSVSSAIQTQVNKEKPDLELYRKQGRAKKKKLGNLEGVKCFNTKIFLERYYYLKTLKIDLHGVEARLPVFQKKATPRRRFRLVTNILHRSPEEVVRKYAKRWKIEEFFKIIKSISKFEKCTRSPCPRVIRNHIHDLFLQYAEPQIIG